MKTFPGGHVVYSVSEIKAACMLQGKHALHKAVTERIANTEIAIRNLERDLEDLRSLDERVADLTGPREAR